MDRLIANGQNKVLTVSGNALKINWLYGYVTNGLVLCLDGIDKGNSEGNWVDLVNGYVFEGFGVPTFNVDHVYFDGTNDYFKNTVFNYVGYTSGTIEVVVDNERTGTGSFVFSPKSAGLMAHLTSNNLRIRAGSSSGKRYDGVPAKASLSATVDHGYANGVEITTTSTGYYSPSGNASYVGARYSNGVQGFFNGKIYSIRFYNRKLSYPEVLNNWWVDNQRFNII